ncbi:hypothetical protein GCM10010271_06680 [Streptomyces kurssanovii]|nr:hypothetical protein GCM10010271_06680 [Streptomyces kurssanovii]
MFAGSFELAAAERVCGGGELPSDAVLETLVGLVDKSVVQRVGEQGERYRLLDSIREYAADLLTASGGSCRVAEEHLAHCHELGRSLWDEMITDAPGRPPPDGPGRDRGPARRPALRVRDQGPGRARDVAGGEARAALARGRDALGARTGSTWASAG